MEVDNYGYDHEEPFVSPIREVNTDIGRLALTWFNTCIRTFIPPTYNHLEVYLEDGMTYGAIASEDVMDWLRENNYPELFMPHVDKSTIKWFKDREDKLAQELLEEIERNNNGTDPTTS